MSPSGGAEVCPIGPDPEKLCRPMLNGIPAATPAAGSDSEPPGFSTGCSYTVAGLYACTLPPVRASLVLLLVRGAPTGGPLPGNATLDGTICGGPGATV